MKLSPDSDVFYESGRHMVVREALLGVLKQLEWLGIMTLVTQMVIVGSLLLRHADIITELRLLGGTSYSKIPTHSGFGDFDGP